MNIQKSFFIKTNLKSLYLITLFTLAATGFLWGFNVEAVTKVNDGTLSLDGEAKLTETAVGGGTGILQICKAAEGPGLENRVFAFRIGGIVREAAVGNCTVPIELPAGQVTIEELLDGRTLPSGTFSGRFRLLNVESSVAGSLGAVNIPLRTAVVTVREGSIANQTVVTFTNTFAVNAVIEICVNTVSQDSLFTAEGIENSPGGKGFYTFSFTVDVLQNTNIVVPSGGCSGPIQVNVPTFASGLGAAPKPGDVIVTELAEPGFILESVSATPTRFNELVLGVGVSNTNPACIDERRDPLTNAVMTGFALPARCFFGNPGGGYTSVDTLEGGTASITKINFFNRPIPAHRTAFDYDGDARADVSVFRPSTNRWYELLSSTPRVAEQTFGLGGDIIAPADYDGDGKTDIGIFRPSSGDWWYLSSIDNVQKSVRWGQAGDVPRPSDYDGDGRADFIVFRPANNTWYRLSRNGQTSIVQFGTAGDKPIVGDFDGDGRSDIAIFRPSSGDWWYLASSNGTQPVVHFGIATDIPVPADYDGDGKTDFAVYRASERTWYISNSSNNSTRITQFGLADDKPVPADYDGDGRSDIAVFRPSEGVWYILRSRDGFTSLQFGISTDIPTPNAFIP